MATTTLPQQLLVTVDSSVSISNVTRAIRMLRGVTAIKKAESTTKKPRLHDPETGKLLNEETMKSIEEAHRDMEQGRLKTYHSVDDMFKDLGINV